MGGTSRPQILSLAVAIAITGCGETSQAWDRSGHRMACVKAWTEFSDQTRAKVAELLDVATEGGFADSCAWADEILAARPETESWHEVRLPDGAREIDLARDCRAPCIITEIDRHAKIVASSAAKPERAEALKFLSHLMADLHQPLRIGFARDRGGRDIAITFFGRSLTMHSLWESALLAAPDPPGHGYTPFLKEMTDRYNRERWSHGAPRDWAVETMWVMRAPPTGYIGNPGGLAFDALYVNQNYLIAIEQIEKSGVRLAYILDQILR